jgi:hypothetical protein
MIQNRILVGFISKYTIIIKNEYQQNKNDTREAGDRGLKK